MVLRIEAPPNSAEATLRLSGRITSSELPHLNERIACANRPLALDLAEVRLVDLDAVRFLAAAERHGIELRGLPSYVRTWITLEKPWVARHRTAFINNLAKGA